MCERCVQLDAKLEHYGYLASRLTDQPTVDGIHELIKRMKAEKATLHPDRK